MEWRCRLATGSEKAAHDVVVVAPAKATGAELIAVLQATSGASPDQTWWCDGHVITPDTPVGAVLTDGAVLHPGRPAAAPNAGPEVWVVGGPEAGRIVVPGGEEIVVGRGNQAGLQLRDPELSRTHARLHFGAGVASVEDLGSANGTLLEGEPIAGVVDVAPGQLVQMGESLVTWQPASRRPERLERTPDGGMAFARPPRLLSPAQPVSIRLPQAPGERGRATFPLAALLAPLVLGVAMAVLTKQPRFLLFVLLSPLMAVANFFSQRKQHKVSHHQELTAYRSGREEVDVAIGSAVDRERDRRRQAHPDPATVLSFARQRAGRLWERRRDDSDFLSLSVGTAGLPADIAFESPPGTEPPTPVVWGAPVAVDLLEAGILGITGPPGAVAGTARWLVGQAAALHSPRDLNIVVLADTGREGSAWAWAAWLPHTRPTAGQPCVALVANDEQTADARIAELTGRATDTGNNLPRVLVVLDGARRLRSRPGMPALLANGAAAGLFFICLDDTERALPEECKAVLAIDPEATRATLRQSGGDDTGDILIDQVSAAWGDDLGHRLAPLRDVSREEGAADLPTTARLTDVLGLEPPTAEGVLDHWRADRPSATLGVTTTGAFTVDLAADGPHGLIVGTTGAGKSELLQTVVASLAVANRPDQMNFVLIDYKGGSAFKECAGLPHTVGMVTDLDGHLTERALTSLGAEIKRRELLLDRAGASNLERYEARRSTSSDPTLEPMPRLLIVIDEFATLADELPDFLTGLVNVARRGRSMGVHLLLATQRPGSQFVADLRANVNLRIALRVTQPDESTNVIDTPDAARISPRNPGRAYARIGPERLIGFQTARVGGHRRAGSRPDDQIAVIAIGWAQLGRPLALPDRDRADRARPVGVEEPVTDLAVLVDAVGDAAERLGLEPARRPWLPPLPARVLLGDLTTEAPNPFLLPFGLEDVPERQVQRPAGLDVVGGSHLLIAGGPRSGRSTLLRTLAGAIASRVSARDLHLYVIDCGNGALLGAADMPHTAAVVTRDQPERADRVINRLLGEVMQRQEILSAGGFADIGEQRAHAPAAQALPYLVVMIDRWEAFLSSFEDLDGGRMVSDFLRLLREAPSAGLRAVIAGDRTAISGRLPSLVEDRLVLRLPDRTDYAMAGLNPRSLPDDMTPGRAFRVTSASEVQIALLDPDDSGPAQAAALARLSAEASVRDADLPDHLRPAPVGVLPTRVDAGTIRQARPAGAGPLWTVLGIGGDRLDPVGIDLALDGPGLVVAGPPRSGRSSTLLWLAQSLGDAGSDVLVLLPRRSPAAALEGHPGIRGVLSGAAITPNAITDVVDNSTGPLVVAIDDAELLAEGPASDALAAVVKEARDRGHAVIAAGTTDELKGGFRGFLPEVRKSKCALLLSPSSPMDGELAGTRLARSALFAGPAGRALLVTTRGQVVVQVPLVRP